METVLDALKAMGKASFREIAARMRIEPVEALNMLREYRDQGKCDFVAGSWRLTGSETAPAEKSSPVNVNRPKDEAPAEVDPDVVRQLLAEHGAMETAALASLVGRNARGMVSVLRSLERAGIVVQNGKGKGVTWSLPAVASEEQATEQADNEQQPDAVRASGGDVTETTTSVQEILDDIPSFTGIEPGGLLAELQRQVTAAKRRHRAEGLRLEEIDSAVRVLNKPCNRGMVEELLQWQSW
jgi:ribosomal protein L30/L7E